MSTPSTLPNISRMSPAEVNRELAERIGYKIYSTSIVTPAGKELQFISEKEALSRGIPRFTEDLNAIVPVCEDIMRGQNTALHLALYVTSKGTLNVSWLVAGVIMEQVYFKQFGVTESLSDCPPEHRTADTLARFAFAWHRENGEQDA